MTQNRLRMALLSAHSCPAGALGTRDTGGMNVYIRELARELGREGHLVDVYTRAHGSREAQIVALGENARLVHLKAGENRKIKKAALYPRLPEFAANLESFVEEGDLRYDLVFSHYWLSGWLGEYLQQQWRVPHMVMFHTLGAAKNAIAIGEAESELRIATERRLVETADHVIAATEKEKWTLARDYGCSASKVGVVPCGVDLELFRPVDKAVARRKLKLGSGRMILCVGRMEPLKGIDNLLLAGSRLRHIPGLRMLLMGGDRYSLAEASRLKALANDLGLDGSVLFLGSVRQDLLPYFYSAADACVIPSHYESFSLVALESLACGTPVVATDVGDLKNIIHDGASGYVVPVNDPDELARGIESLLSWPSRDRESASVISASVRRFSWPNIATAIMEECRETLAAHRAENRCSTLVRTTGCVS